MPSAGQVSTLDLDGTDVDVDVSTWILYIQYMNVDLSHMKPRHFSRFCWDNDSLYMAEKKEKSEFFYDAHTESLFRERMCVYCMTCL